jgi:uncharacterized membrane protein YkvA (DUF1232 family)
MARTLSWLLRPGLLKALFFDVRLASRLFREPRVPVLTKAIIPVAALYFVSPVDLLPDFIPVLGEMDDLVVAYGALRMFISMCPPAVDAYHRAALAARRRFSRMEPADAVIEAEYHRHP